MNQITKANPAQIVLGKEHNIEHSNKEKVNSGISEAIIKKKSPSSSLHLFSNLMIDFDLITLVRAGFYEIKHLPSGKRYVGQSQNLLERLGKHVAFLQNKVHECLPLQADWTKEAHNLKEAFSIKAFDYVPLGDSKEQRQEETAYIQSQDPLTLYNVIPDKSVKKENVRKRVHIKGVLYDSIKQAAAVLDRGETSIRRWVHNPRLEDCYIVETIKHGYKKCMVDGKEYPSIISLVDAGLAPTPLFAVRRFNSTNFPNWYFLGQDNESLKKVRKKSLPKPCMVDGIKYLSVRALITAGVATSRNYAVNRLGNPKFPDWQYL